MTSFLWFLNFWKKPTYDVRWWLNECCLCMGGGSETTIVQPEAPQPPTATESMQEYIKSLPQLYETQMKYSPLLAAQQVGLAQEFAAPYGQAIRDAQMAIAPETTALQEDLAVEAREGMQEGMPDWMREQYRSDLAANTGTNVGSPIAADYMSRGLLEQEMNWQRYNRDLGLSVAGRQPIAQPYTPQTPDWMSGYTPGQVMGANMQGYGMYTNATSPIVLPGEPSPWGQVAGSLAGGIGTGLGIGFASDVALKENIDKIDSALEKIERIDGVMFDWKHNGERDGGVVAQQIEEIIPDSTIDINGVKHIKPMVLIGYLIEAVKELSEGVKKNG